MIGYDEFWYEDAMKDFFKWILRDQLKKPMNLSEKKREYPPELKTKTREANTLEEMMYMYRDSIAYKMMESIRKDCEEE